MATSWLNSQQLAVTIHVVQIKISSGLLLPFDNRSRFTYLDRSFASCYINCSSRSLSTFRMPLKLSSQVENPFCCLPLSELEQAAHCFRTTRGLLGPRVLESPFFPDPAAATGFLVLSIAVPGSYGSWPDLQECLAGWDISLPRRFQEGNGRVKRGSGAASSYCRSLECVSREHSPSRARYGHQWTQYLYNVVEGSSLLRTDKQLDVVR